MTSTSRSILASLLAGLALVALTAAVHADAPAPRPAGDRLEWPLDAGPDARAVLTVAGPDGFTLRRTFTDGETPSVERTALPVADGAFRWRLELLTPPAGERSGRAAGSPSAVSTGSFRIADGAFVTPGAGLEDAGRDVLYIDDVIVSANLCVGTGCVNNESFGTDVLRLKDVNNRIHFQDTSVGSYPTRDWRITANADTSGGASFFAVDDVDGGTTPFSLAGGAADASLAVGTGGNVGFGTDAPLEKLHTVSGDTPTLRLEQDGSSGFSPQTWDVGGNEAGFFVRDGAGSTDPLPLRIRPDAPTNSLYVDDDGDVGLGTAFPAGTLHLQRTAPVDPLEMLILENNGKPRLVLDNNGDIGGRWFFGLNNTSEFVVSYVGATSNVLRLDQAGNLYTLGSVNPPSDARLKRGVEAVTGRRVLETLATLPIATWSYHWEDGAVRHIGPMAQDFHAAFGFGPSDTTIATVDADGVALAAIQGLHQVVEEKQTEIDELKARLAALEALVEAMAEADGG